MYQKACRQVILAVKTGRYRNIHSSVYPIFPLCVFEVNNTACKTLRFAAIVELFVHCVYMAVKITLCHALSIDSPIALRVNFGLLIPQISQHFKLWQQQWCILRWIQTSGSQDNLLSDKLRTMFTHGVIMTNSLVHVTPNSWTFYDQRTSLLWISNMFSYFCNFMITKSLKHKISCFI